MAKTGVTFANPMGEILSPILTAIRSTGFFEAYVYLPAMTLLGIATFWLFVKRVHINGFLAHRERKRFRFIWYGAIFSLCFLVTNAMAVAVKTMIIQETDYDPIPSYIAWVSPLHFYIVSVASAHLYLIWRNRQTAIDLFLSIYIQIGLLAGYYIGFYRLTNEPIELSNITSGISGVSFFIWFGILNWDLFSRLFVPANAETQKYKMRDSQRSV